MPSGPTTTPADSVTDRECLSAWRQAPTSANLRPLLERYVALVYNSAFRRTASPESATEVTRAVFLVLARRARKLRKNTVLAGWLFHVTSVACRKLPKDRRCVKWWRWFRRSPQSAS